MNRAIVESESDEEINLVDSDGEEFKQQFDSSNGERDRCGHLLRPKNPNCKLEASVSPCLEDVSDCGGEDGEHRDGVFGISSKDKRKRALDRLIQTRTEEDRRHRRSSFQNARSKYIISDDENEEAKGTVVGEEQGSAQKEENKTSSSSVRDDDTLRFSSKRKKRRNILEKPESDKKLKRRSGGQIVVGERDYYSEASSGNDLSDFIAGETDNENSSDDQEKQEDSHRDTSQVEDPSVAISSDEDPKIIVSSDEEDLLARSRRNRASNRTRTDSEDEMITKKRPVSNKIRRLRKVKESHNEYKMDLRASVKQSISPLERIKKAQQSVFGKEKAYDTKQISDSISPLTDQGESDSSSDISSEENGIIVNRRLGSGVRSHEIQSEPEAWEREINSLGINKMAEEDAFRAYVEYCFMCMLDDTYEDQVKQSKSHEQLYSQAIRRVEYLLATAQDSVHSEVWRNCDIELLESLKNLSQMECGWRDKPEKSSLSLLFHEEGGLYCAACGKDKCHVTKPICFFGRISRKTNASASDDEHITSQQNNLSYRIYQRDCRFQLGTRVSAPASEQVVKGLLQHADSRGYIRKCFDVGVTCSKRLALFHALYHYRYHAMVFLKGKLKRELRRAKSSYSKIEHSSLIDATLSDHNMEELYSQFKFLLSSAQSYQLSGGEEEQSQDFAGPGRQHSDLPQDVLLGPRGTDISSIDWGDSDSGEEILDDA